MRKSIVSFIAGFLLAVGVSVAYADVETYIGKKVDGQFPLIVDGEISDVPAITIEGRSYIPLRSAGELLGVSVSWIDGEVIVDKIQADRQSETAMTPEEYAELARIEQEEFDRNAQRKNEISLQISRLNGKIEYTKIQIQKTKSELERREANLKNVPEYIELTVDGAVPYEGSDLQRQHQEMLAQLRQEIVDLEAQLAELEQQKAELEKQKAELEEQQN